MVASQSPVCQSCAMPMSKQGECGTHSDGSQHDEYCTYSM